MKFKGTVIITDPCYLGIEDVESKIPGLFDSTGYGDWSCTTFVDSPETRTLLEELNNMYAEFYTAYNFSNASDEKREEMLNEYLEKRKAMEDTPLILGQFCADSGEVCVVLLEDVLKLNPSFNYHTDRKWTTTTISDFDGDINIEEDEEGNSVVGIGNINFYTAQTGL
jgi:hypothetical protein